MCLTGGATGAGGSQPVAAAKGEAKGKQNSTKGKQLPEKAPAPAKKNSQPRKKAGKGDSGNKETKEGTAVSGGAAQLATVKKQTRKEGAAAAATKASKAAAPKKKSATGAGGSKPVAAAKGEAKEEQHSTKGKQLPEKAPAPAKKRSQPRKRAGKGGSGGSARPSAPIGMHVEKFYSKGGVEEELAGFYATGSPGREEERKARGAGKPAQLAVSSSYRMYCIQAQLSAMGVPANS